MLTCKTTSLQIRNTQWASLTIRKIKWWKGATRGVTTKGPTQQKGVTRKKKRTAQPAPEELGSQGKTPSKRDPQNKNHSQCQSALKWALRGARLHPFLPYRWIASTCADLVPSPGAPSVIQAKTQQFPYSKPTGIYRNIQRKVTVVLENPFNSAFILLTA